MNFGIKKEYWFVITAGMLSGLIVFMGPIFMGLGLSVYEICSLAYIVVSIVLLPSILLNPSHHYKKGFIGLIIAFCLAAIVTTFSQYIAVIIGTPVAIVVLLLYTQPLWTTLISAIFLKEKVTLRIIISCILVLIGIIFLINPFQSAGNISTIGVIISLIGGFGFSGWIVLGSVLSKKGNSPINSLFSAMTAILLFAILTQPLAAKLVHDSAITNLSLNHPAKTWFIVIIFGLVTNLATNLFYLNGVKKIRTIDAGIIMILEPVVGVILAAIFLHQPITLSIFIGGILILLANYLVISNNGERMNDFCQVKFNCKTGDEANKIISALLKARLVACADSFNIQAQYWWNGQMINEKRIQVVTYSMSKLKKEVVRMITKLHSDEVPAIIFSSFESNNDYLNWIKTTLISND